jgi:hypothetical protein
MTGACIEGGGTMYLKIIPGIQGNIFWEEHDMIS